MQFLLNFKCVIKMIYIFKIKLKYQNKFLSGGKPFPIFLGILLLTIGHTP